MLRAYDRYRYAILFYTLLLSLAVPPLTQSFGFSGDVAEWLLALNLVAAVSASGVGPLRPLLLSCAALLVLARPGAAWLEQRTLATAALAAWGVLALGATAAVLRFSLRGSEVGGEQVHAALSAYLLAGLFLGLLYWVVEAFVPGSLSVGGAAATGGLSIATTVYFSFVTLASLGYGDVLPVSDLARGLAVFEAVGGQLYLAVLVARLVGAWR